MLIFTTGPVILTHTKWLTIPPSLDTRPPRKILNTHYTYLTIFIIAFCLQPSITYVGKHCIAAINADICHIFCDYSLDSAPRQGQANTRGWSGDLARFTAYLVQDQIESLSGRLGLSVHCTGWPDLHVTACPVQCPHPGTLINVPSHQCPDNDLIALLAHCFPLPSVLTMSTSPPWFLIIIISPFLHVAGDRWLVQCLGCLYSSKGLFYRVVPADQGFHAQDDYGGIFRYNINLCKLSPIIKTYLPPIMAITAAPFNSEHLTVWQ